MGRMVVDGRRRRENEREREADGRLGKRELG